MSGLVTTSTTIAGILVAMAVLAAVETAIPLRERGRWGRFHVGPNLALTLVTFVTNAVLNAAVVTMLTWQAAAGVGLLHTHVLPPLAATVLVVVTLDLAFYVSHVAMHASPALWRVHRVHHSDPLVDVTTTIRQHPGEGIIRYAFLAAAAYALGASPAAFAVYRTWSALNGLLEHANVRAPQALDAAVSWIVTTPNMHKVHHSRRRVETNSNYGNIFAVFDRLFATFTPSPRGVHVTYGLDGLDEPAVQTAAGLLTLPFRPIGAARGRFSPPPASGPAAADA